MFYDFIGKSFVEIVAYVLKVAFAVSGTYAICLLIIFMAMEG